MFGKPLSMRWSLFALVGIPILWFVIWLALGWLVQAVGIKLAPGTDITALLAIVGGIMGAIFTVGGLVVALVAVLTQLQLQDRVTQVLSKTRQDLEDRFNNELIQKYEQSTQNQVEGTLAFFQATLARDWKEAERLTSQALDKYPKLRGARSFLGLRMSSDVETHFSTQCFRPPSTLWQPFEVRSDFARYAGARYFFQAGEDSVGGLASPPLIYPVQTPLITSMGSVSDPPRQEAITWLNTALEVNDNPDGRVSTALALMFGVSEAYGKMIQAVRNAITSNPTGAQDFLTQLHIAMLVYACRNELPRIERLGELIEYPLPVSVEDIQASVEQLDPKWPTKQVDWYAEEIGPQASSLYPALVQIIRKDEDDGRITVSALVFPHDGKQYSYPEPTRDSSSQSQPSMSVEDLVTQLSTRLCFLYRS